MLIEIINHLSPITMIIFSITNKNINYLCRQHQYYKIFNQNTKKIDCGHYYSMIIKNHHLYSMGAYPNTLSTVNHYDPTLLCKGVISVHCGSHHCLFFTSKHVYGVGSNQYGQLGLDLKEDLHILPFSPHDVLCIACTESHSFILTVQGLYGFGKSGFIDDIDFSYTPTLIPFNAKGGSDKQILQISCGDAHMIIRTEHCYYGYGCNKSGQLGLPYNEIIWDNINTLKVECGMTHTVFLLPDGAYGLGSNMNGQLGLGLLTYIYTPTKIMDDVIDICCGADHTLFLTSDGLYGCGSSYYGELGLGNNITHHKPVKLKIKISNDIKLACGYGHTIVKTQDYMMFGSNRYSQLGLGKYKLKKYNKPKLLKVP